MQENLRKQVEQQQQIINYLQDKYKQSTGHQLKLPQTWQQFLDVEESKAPIMNTNQEFYQNKQEEEKSDNDYQIEKEEKAVTFLQAVINLDLPIRQVQKQDTKKAGSMQKKKTASLTTSFNPANKNHMREIIDLSDFVHRNFNKPSFKEFLGNITDMRCLSSLILRNNGIDDTFIEEIDILFNNTRITRLDLSGNEIGKKGAQHIAKLLKEKVTHIEWLDLSRNNFGTEVQTLTQLVQGLKKQTNLYHFCLNSNTYQTHNIQNQEVLSKLVISEQIFKFVKENQNLQSFGLIDSKITHKSMQGFAQYLATNQCTLTGINLQYCFLDLKHTFDLGKGISRNRSLIKLDLSCNGLEPICGIYISRAIKENVFLADINLSKNLFNDDFAIHLSESLKFNQTLFKCELQGNPIGQKGAEELLRALHEDNDTIESFGDITATNTNMGVLNIQLIKKALRVNSVSKDVKSKLIEQQINTIAQDPRDINIKQTQFEQNQTAYENEFDDYKLLKPILFTNQPYKDPSQFKIWNV